MNDNKEFEHEIDPDLLAEIEEWEKTDHDEPAEYYFSNPDPYLKPQPLPPDHPRRNCYFNEDGHLCAKNLSAFWVPELTVTEVIHGTVYTVTGSYEGTESFVRKLERITNKKFEEKMEDSEMNGATSKITALYCRLSQEDERAGESLSIENQELLCRGWFLPPNAYDCGSFVVNGTAVVGKEQNNPYNRCKSTQKGADSYEISI